MSIGRFVAFDSNKEIFEKGNPPRAVYLILKGQVRLENNEPPPLPYQVMTHIPPSEKERTQPPPDIKQVVSVKGVKDVIGDQEVLSESLRKETAITESKENLSVIYIMCA